MRPSNELKGIYYCLLFFTIRTLGHEKVSESAKCEDGIISLVATTSPQTIHSSNYPSPYDNNQDCRWMISAPLGLIKLTVHPYDIEYGERCTFDSLTIFDGPSPKKACSALFCGLSSSPTEYVTSSSKAFIYFHSDSSGVRRGFKLDFQNVDCNMKPNIRCKGSDDDILYPVKNEILAYDSSCEGAALHLHATSQPGSIKSPNFPSAYDNGAKCRWVIKAPHGRIKITVHYYDIEFGLNCMYDRLIISDAWTKSDCSVSLCGRSNSAEEYVTSSNAALIQFLTDKTKSYSGFSLTFQMVDKNKWDTTPTIPCII